MANKLSTFTLDEDIKAEFKEKCERLGHEMSIVIEVMMEMFNARNREVSKEVRKYGKIKKKNAALGKAEKGNERQVH
jgi:antitoxin component of RelBE/YafQ-DinJ toxin-antitoxin module